ncbi:MAG: EAL domain-containing protein [Pseudolabrys sp.]|nr:EAL domain-containing protein [Pseudolabrys sp.]
MLRLGAIFIAVCMVLIAASIGAVLYIGLKLDARTAALAALTVLTALALYNTISNRLRDRATLGDQIADLSRGTADLSRQMAEMSRRVATVESRVETTASRTRGAVDPIAAEISELGGLVRQIADTVAGHETILREHGAMPQRAAAASPPEAAAAPVADATLTLSETDTVTGARRFQGMSREAIGELIAQAADSNRIDLYLQPIVTLPQRKVRFYEALSRLRTEAGDIIPAGDFIDIADSAGLMPKIDNLLVFRCVQVVRRLQLKSRDVGLFCNISASTLTDPTYFKQLLDFVEANRALAGSLTFEFTQKAYRDFGPIEQESLAALAECGFRFSMDHVTELPTSPKELADRSFRFLKVPAKLLLNRAATAQSDIHAEDLADLMARSGIDLIGERIESESMVVDLLDYDVRFGQGFLFSAPRPVRAEALQGGASAAPAPDKSSKSSTLSEYLAASAPHL